MPRLPSLGEGSSSDSGGGPRSSVSLGTVVVRTRAPSVPVPPVTVLVDVLRRRPPARSCGRSPCGRGRAGSAGCRPRDPVGLGPGHDGHPVVARRRDPVPTMPPTVRTSSPTPTCRTAARLCFGFCCWGRRNRKYPARTSTTSTIRKVGFDFLAVVAPAGPPWPQIRSPRHPGHGGDGGRALARRTRSEGPAGRQGVQASHRGATIQPAIAGRTPAERRPNAVRESPDRLPPAVAGRRPGRMPDRTGGATLRCNLIATLLPRRCNPLAARSLTKGMDGRSGLVRVAARRGRSDDRVIVWGRSSATWEPDGGPSGTFGRGSDRPGRQRPGTVRIGGRGPWLHLPRARRGTGPAGTRTGRVGEACGRRHAPPLLRQPL